VLAVADAKNGLDAHTAIAMQKRQRALAATTAAAAPGTPAAASGSAAARGAGVGGAVASGSGEAEGGSATLAALLSSVSVPANLLPASRPAPPVLTNAWGAAGAAATGPRSVPLPGLCASGGPPTATAAATTPQAARPGPCCWGLLPPLPAPCYIAGEVAFIEAMMAAVTSDGDYTGGEHMAEADKPAPTLALAAAPAGAALPPGFLGGSPPASAADGCRAAWRPAAVAHAPALPRSGSPAAAWPLVPVPAGPGVTYWPAAPMAATNWFASPEAPSHAPPPVLRPWPCAACAGWPAAAPEPGPAPFDTPPAPLPTPAARPAPAPALAAPALR
jgi:hypothetical protein